MASGDLKQPRMRITVNKIRSWQSIYYRFMDENFKEIQGQGSRSNAVFLKCCLYIYHEWMIGSWSNFHVELILMKRSRLYRARVIKSKVKVKYTIMWKHCLSHKLGMGEYIFIKRIHKTDAKRTLELNKVKVTRSKVKVKYAMNWKIV